MFSHPSVLLSSCSVDLLYLNPLKSFIELIQAQYAPLNIAICYYYYCGHKHFLK